MDVPLAFTDLVLFIFWVSQLYESVSIDRLSLVSIQIAVGTRKQKKIYIKVIDKSKYQEGK